jgi:hypothetical protein
MAFCFMNTGQIIKSKTNSDFTLIPNHIAKSENLTLEQKGLLLHLLSLPANWVIYKENLYKQIANQKGTIDRIFKELQELGYILSVKKIDDKGKFEGWNHIVYDKPTETKTDRVQQKPSSGFTEVGQSAPILSTNSVLSTNDILNTNTLSWFKNQIDEIYINNIKLTHKGKNIEEAISQAYSHLAAEPERLRNMTASDCKRFLNGWLSNMKAPQAGGRPGRRNMTDEEFLNKIK